MSEEMMVPNEGNEIQECISQKVCPNCGEKLPLDSAFCIKCGTKIEENLSSNNEVSEEKSFVKTHKKKIVLFFSVILGILVIAFIINSVQASVLKNELMRDWQTVEGDDGSYILCILDFSDEEIEYRVETGFAWIDTTIATYEYKVQRGNKIKVKRFGDEWETFEIEFNDEKTMMTVSPALTSADDYEFWFHLD